MIREHIKNERVPRGIRDKLIHPIAMDRITIRSIHQWFGCAMLPIFIDKLAQIADVVRVDLGVDLSAFFVAKFTVRRQAKDQSRRSFTSYVLCGAAIYITYKAYMCFALF